MFAELPLLFGLRLHMVPLGYRKFPNQMCAMPSSSRGAKSSNLVHLSVVCHSIRVGLFQREDARHFKVLLDARFPWTCFDAILNFSACVSPLREAKMALP